MKFKTNYSNAYRSEIEKYRTINSLLKNKPSYKRFVKSIIEPKIINTDTDKLLKAFEES